MTTESTSSETSTQQKEFSPYFLWWLVILTVGTLLLLRFDDHYYSILPYFPLPSNFATIFVLSLSYSPWLIAGAITISNGITEFSGDAYKLITVGVELSSLIGILTGFIVGPTLFFFAWRKAKESLRLSFSRTEHFSPSTINFILGGIVCIPIFGCLNPVSLLSMGTP